MNTLSEYSYFYILKNITSYTILLVFTIVESLQFILNPPYSMNLETNIGKTFLKLVKKHFPRNNSFHKISTRTPSRLVIVAWEILVR